MRIILTLSLFLHFIIYLYPIPVQKKELKVTYDFKEEIKQGPQHDKTIEITASKNKLIGHVIFKTRMSKPVQDETGKIISWENYFNETIHSKLYKDYARNIMVYNGQSLGEQAVKENLNLFDWSLNNSKDTILGYSCDGAETTFRGRSYIAFFTTEIPFKAAPWKFHGLPGVLLKVESKDGFACMEAETISITTQKTEIENPFQNSKILTYNEYIELRKEIWARNKERVKKHNALNLGPAAVLPDLKELEVISYE